MEEAPSSSSNLAFSLGIDVGKANLELALRSKEDIVERTTVPNDSEGHSTLVDWLSKQGASPEETRVCMEASGDFEEAIAQHLYDNGYRVSVVNPRRIKGYASSQLQRTKTDAADASLIARFGQREDPRPWEPASAAESRLQELTRARQALQKEKTRTQNRLDEAEDEAVQKAHQNLLDEIKRQIEDLEEEIEERVEENSELNDQCSLLETIPGVGLQTAAIVVSELGSPEQFESTSGGRLRRPCTASSEVGHLHPRQSSNVESRQRTPASSDVFSGNDGSSIQFSSEGIRRSSQGARERENGRDRSGDAEALAYLLRGSQIRPSLRSLAASRDLIRLTLTTASVWRIR